MTKVELHQRVLGLPAEERAELAAALMRSLDADVPVYQWQRDAVAEALADPDKTVAGDEVFARLRARPRR